MKTTAITNRDIEERPAKLTEYNFPELGLTVEARSLEEAREKLKKLTEK